MDDPYINQWLSVTKWYYEVDIPNWSSVKGRKKKMCKLTLGQIEGMIHLIKECRNKKLYEIADYARDRLVECGYYWFMSEIVNTGNLLGHTLDQMVFRADRDGEISIEGYVYTNWGNETLSYTTNVTKQPVDNSIDKTK